MPTLPAATRGSTLEAKRQQIDEQISALEDQVVRVKEEILKLKSQRNDLSPIAHLPNELLCKVFSDVKDVYETHYPLAPTRWARISRVCRRWRNAALSNASLWTTITDDDPERLRAFMARSKGTSLNITLKGKALPPDVDRMMQQSLSDTHRLASLVIQSDIYDLRHRTSGLGPAPKLHTLSLRNVSKHPDELGNILREGAPLLRNLQLDCCRIPWTSPLFNGLTTLKLKSETDSTWDVAGVLDAFARIPALEFLDWGVHFRTGTLPVPDERLVRFRHLKHLSLSGQLSICLEFLAHIAIPETASARIESSEDGTLPQSGAILPQRLLEATPTTPLSQAVRVQDQYQAVSIEVIGSSKIRVEHWPTLSMTKSSRLVYVLSGWGTHGPRSFCGMSLGAVQYLYLSYGELRRDADAVEQAFEMMPAVEQVVLSRAAGGRFVKALKHNPSLFPTLTFLSFHDVTFFETPKSRSCTCSKRSATGFSDLVALLPRPGLEKLSFRRCANLTKDHIEILSAFDVEVEWDAIEQNVDRKCQSTCISQIRRR
ncbi:hypothetical protein CC2G_012642 [Coprinopsis cinerea AmutBmut pab1-1]|nr:hypothetical protein CC2G_012642 [Coprinopsis cinerea AmutBmut pab1-1]KAG2009747.1 hypothetical protein CC2G_012642 [Coprinopsis cinerea AmutBmut pab1-1]